MNRGLSEASGKKRERRTSKRVLERRRCGATLLSRIPQTFARMSTNAQDASERSSAALSSASLELAQANVLLKNFGDEFFKRRQIRRAKCGCDLLSDGTCVNNIFFASELDLIDDLLWEGEGCENCCARKKGR